MADRLALYLPVQQSTLRYETTWLNLWGALVDSSVICTIITMTIINIGTTDPEYTVHLTALG